MSDSVKNKNIVSRNIVFVSIHIFIVFQNLFKFSFIFYFLRLE
jgi:hypothetical protein